MLSDNEIGNTFAERLRILREEKGLNQSQLAEMLKVSRGAVSYYERAERVPDIVFASRAANFFNVPTDYLLGQTDDPNRVPSAMDELGLSGKTLEWFKSLKETSFSRNNMAAELCAIMEKSDFQLLMYNLREYRAAVTAEAIFSKKMDQIPMDCLMQKDTAKQKYKELRDSIAQIASSDKCDVFVSKYLELLPLLFTDGTDGPDVAKMASLLATGEGFKPSELCAHKANKWLTLLMEDIKSEVSSNDIICSYEQSIEKKVE